jgi:hypothetical protein
MDGSISRFDGQEEGLVDHLNRVYGICSGGQVNRHGVGEYVGDEETMERLGCWPDATIGGTSTVGIGVERYAREPG